MSLEQKQKLYRVASLHIMRFQLNNTNYWDRDSYIADSQLSREIDAEENKYKELYGDLPEMEYIEDVFRIYSQLKKDLKGE